MRRTVSIKLYNKLYINKIGSVFVDLLELNFEKNFREFGLFFVQFVIDQLLNYFLINRQRFRPGKILNLQPLGHYYNIIAKKMVHDQKLLRLFGKHCIQLTEWKVHKKACKSLFFLLHERKVCFKSFKIS